MSPPTSLLVSARALLAQGQLAAAASMMDQAFGKHPDSPVIRAERAALLERLSVTWQGLRFRYIPAGTFEMGSVHGEADERPVHSRAVPAFWMAEVPLTWAAYCRLAGLSAPPQGMPSETVPRERRFEVHEGNKIRRYYCKSDAGEGKTYDDKPVVVIAPSDADALCATLSDLEARIFLPSEAQWEKAARGGLIGARYAWGEAPPDPERCDFGRFRDFAIRPSRALPPNDYGLYGMCGGVWEWTADCYDAAAYANGGPAPEAAERVLRGGSWADCAAAVTVSFRMSARAAFSPTVGMRLAAEFTAP